MSVSLWQRYNSDRVKPMSQMPFLSMMRHFDITVMHTAPNSIPLEYQRNTPLFVYMENELFNNRRRVFIRHISDKTHLSWSVSSLCPCSQAAILGWWGRLYWEQDACSTRICDRTSNSCREINTDWEMSWYLCGCITWLGQQCAAQWYLEELQSCKCPLKRYVNV